MPAQWNRGAAPPPRLLGVATRVSAASSLSGILAPAIERANERRAEAGLAPLPEGLTPHSLRRTFISLLLAVGEDVPYVMAQAGHTDPKVTLSIYAQVMFRGDGEREALRELVGEEVGPILHSRNLLRDTDASHG